MKKISILITSYKAAVIPFNNPIGACPCHCQTAPSAPLCSPSSTKAVFKAKVESTKVSFKGNTMEILFKVTF